ncbi:Hypothetical predicted protein [Xyrichtys novacula]|uniref:Uncharacterized protein n=1 Tax=Xyrichtys novacula TaxID=13765 RepID=A0AAV1H5K1_XYRNO|nr:Hypothetical predicted protein [Xyrichtys novacula]
MSPEEPKDVDQPCDAEEDWTNKMTWRTSCLERRGEEEKKKGSYSRQPTGAALNSPRKMKMKIKDSCSREAVDQRPANESPESSTQKVKSVAASSPYTVKESEVLSNDQNEGEQEREQGMM